MTSIDIIIKAFNEEKRIEQCIKSALIAKKGYKGQIILVDSLSTDNTIRIAKRYNIRIIQIEKSIDRSCGVGGQLGFEYSTSEYIYLLDADMILEPEFINKALKEFDKDEKLAGVRGNIRQMIKSNIYYKTAAKRKQTMGGYKILLNGGGLYRRSAILDVGYLTNRNLHAYEEAELGFRLTSKGWKLKIINEPCIKHYGYNTKSNLSVILHKIKYHFVDGSGELIRASIGKTYLLKSLLMVKLYLLTILLAILLIISIIIRSTPLIVFLLLLLMIRFIIVYYNTKKLSYTLFSLILTIVYTIGLLRGMTINYVNPRKKIGGAVLK